MRKTASFRTEKAPQHPKKTLYRHFLYILIAENILLVLICFISWRTFMPPPTNLRYQSLTPDNKSYPSGQLTWSQHFEAVPCDKSPEEAKARGCRFDMLATAWLPPRCIDYELVDGFTKLGNWQFYTEMHGSKKHSSYEPEVFGIHHEAQVHLDVESVAPYALPLHVEENWACLGQGHAGGCGDGLGASHTTLYESSGGGGLWTTPRSE